MKRIGFGLLFFLAAEGFAQQDPQFTQYMFNNFYYNPAFAGTDGDMKITGLYRAQWLGYTATYGDGGAPTTLVLSAHTPMARLRGGIGGYVVNDNLGPLTNTEVQGSYAYHRTVKGARLSVGIRGGMISQKVNFDLYRAIDSSDPLLNRKGTETQIRPDFAVGALYRRDKYYVGVGLNHLNRASYDFGLTQQNQLRQHLYVTGAYSYDMNFDVRIQFVAMVKSDFVKSSFDVGAIAYVRNTMWGGLSFRQSDALSMIFGYSLLQDKSLKLGYSLDYIINDQDAKQATSHEFMASYTLPVETSRRKVIRTPRFRY
ncbi:MAG: type IX secretion system membrane protein PorP/SprF [Cytophagales bacterium]|nr:type IX secretion system membrane protein PorP/SprF [Cytophagales bacterium]